MNRGAAVVTIHDGLAEDRRECFGILLELAVILGELGVRWCVVGGWAVYSLVELYLGTREEPLPWLHHQGSQDVDLAIGWPTLSPDVARNIAEKLKREGYVGPSGFHWFRRLPNNARYTVDLMTVPPPGHEEALVQVGDYQFGAFRDGEVAFVAPKEVLLQGRLPDGQPAQAPLWVASAAALVVIKAQLAARKGSGRHAYDAYLLLRTYPDGPEQFVQELRPLVETETLREQVSRALEALGILFGEGGGGPRLVADVLVSYGGERRAYETDARLTVQRFLRACRMQGLV